MSVDSCVYCGGVLPRGHSVVCARRDCLRRAAVLRTLLFKQRELEEIEKRHPGMMVRCEICHFLCRSIHTSHLRTHATTIEEYKQRFPGSPLHGAVQRACMRPGCGMPVKALHAKLCSSDECRRCTPKHSRMMKWSF